MKKSLNFLATKNLYSIFIHVTLIALAFEVVILAKQNRKFKQAPSSVESIAVGDRFSIGELEPIQADYDLYPRSKRLFFIFSTRCSFCEKNMPMWKQVIQRTNRDQVPIIGISLDSKEDTIAYVEEKSLEIPIFYPLQKETFAKINKLAGVPTTILIDETGYVKNVWRGTLSASETTNVVEAALN